MDDEKASLNYDCNQNLFLAKHLIINTNRHNDRRNAIKWLRFLMKSDKNISEMKLRNDFMYYLVLNLQRGYLRAPFNNPPPVVGKLRDIAMLLPVKEDDNSHTMGDILDLDHTQDPFIKSKSPDNGAFLALQPVPRDGSFCYLALTAKEKID